MPALGGRQPYSVSILDASGETKSILLFTGEITSVSIAGLLAELGDFKTALEGVLRGDLQKEHWGEETIITNTRPTDKDAQVESEVLVRVVGATTEAPWSFRIPAVNYSAFNYAEPPAGDQVILAGAGASAATTALVAALEATFKMPTDETEAIVVVGIEVVR